MKIKGITFCIFCAISIALISGCPTPEPEPGPTAPPVMSAPTLTAGNGQLTASWIDPTTWNWGDNKAVNAITSYNLRYREVGSESWTEINSGITGTSHTITELTNGDTYHVQVRAINAQGTGGWSASATATPIAPPTAPPVAPGTMAAPTLEVGNGQLIATWTAPENDGGSPITGYELQYRTDAGAWTRISSGIACENSEGQTEVCHFSFSSYSSYTIHSITADGANYQLQVRAVNAQGSGEWSATAMLLFATQVPAGEAAVAIFPADIDNPIAPEIVTELSISLTAVGASNIITVGDGDITSVTSVATPNGVTPPTVDSSSGLITLTVTADTTAGTYVIYDNNATGTDGLLFAEYFFVTESPQDKTQLQTRVTEGIDTWGNTGNFNYIITATVTDMSSIFNSKTSFNGDISGWDVSAVTNMFQMFNNASAFNGDISAWDVGSVTITTQMFNSAATFNTDISGWDVGSLTTMPFMFNSAIAFNVDLEEWKDHWTLDGDGKYTGTIVSMFDGSGVVSNTDGSDMSKPTGVGTPSWY